MAAMAADPALIGEHNWGGEPQSIDDLQTELADRLAADGMLGLAAGTLVVELDDGTAIGDVSWRTERWGPSPRSSCPAFGIALLPPFRGLGHGTVAQRLIIDYLFERQPDLHRVQSDTAADNLAERRTLAKIGMVEEGVVRNAEFRDGGFHDHILFSVLRSEWEAGREP